MKYFWDNNLMTFERQSRKVSAWYSFIHKKWYPYRIRNVPSAHQQVPDLALILHRIKL